MPSERLNTFLLICTVRAISSGELSSLSGSLPSCSRRMRSSSWRRILHLRKSRLLEADVDAVVLGDTADVSRQGVAHGHRAEELVVVYHAPVAVLDHHAVSDLALRGDDDPHLLMGPHRDDLVVDEPAQLHRGHAASRDVVLVEIDHVAVPDHHASLLVAVRQEEVLAVQAPVEEGPVLGLVYHAQRPDLADLQQRAFGRGHEPVLRVVVYEHLLCVAGLVGQRGVTVRQEHLVVLLVGQVESVVGGPADGQGLNASGFDHLFRRRLRG